MKKRISVALAALLIATFAVSLTACFGGNNQKEYTILGITYLPDHEYTDAWIYTDADQQYAPNNDAFSIAFEVKVKDSAGNEFVSITGVDSQGAATTSFTTLYDESGTNIRIAYSVTAVEKSEAAMNVPVSVTFSQYSAAQYSGYAAKFSESITVQGYVDVVRAIKSYDLALGDNFKYEYNRGEELNLAGATLDVTYYDESSESIPFADLLELPQFKGTSVDGFNTEIVGLRKNMSFRAEIQDKGSRTSTVTYRVLPSSDWSMKSVPNIDYYIQDGMTATTKAFHDLDFEEIQLASSEVVMKMAYDKNYLYTAISPSASAYEDIINEGVDAEYPLYSAFHALIPNGQTATVTSVTLLRGTTAVEYTLTDSTKNTMYVVMTAFTGNLHNQKAITITIENSNLLTEAEKSIILDFVSLIAIK